MGFDPQTAGQPIVNVHKRTTKVNFAVAIAVVVFLAIGAVFIVWASHREARGEPAGPSPAARP